MNRIEKIIPVVEIPSTARCRSPGDYPSPILFFAEDRAVIMDSVSNYHIAIVKKDKWCIIWSDSLPEGSVLLSAKLIECQLHLLTRTILEPKFDSLLQLLVLDDSWQTVAKKHVWVRKKTKTIIVRCNRRFIAIRLIFRYLETHNTPQ